MVDEKIATMLPEGWKPPEKPFETSIEEIIDYFETEILRAQSRHEKGFFASEPNPSQYLIDEHKKRLEVLNEIKKAAAVN